MDADTKAEWRAGWFPLFVYLVVYAISGIHLYSMGALIGPIEKDVGWTRAQISGGLLIESVLVILLAPFVGALFDRFGARRVALPGMFLYCAALAMLSRLAGNSVWLWWAVWVAIAIGGTFIKPMIWAGLVSRRFSTHRGLALAIFLCGSGVSTAVLPPLATWLNMWVGWRNSYLVLGVGAAFLTLPLLFVVLGKDDKPRDMPAGGQLGSSVKDVLKSSLFLRIVFAALVMGFGMAALIVHFIPMVTLAGLNATKAAAIASVIGIALAVGRIGSGFLLDRFHGAVFAAISFILPIVALILLLAYKGDVGSAILIAAVIGFCAGAQANILAYITGRYFGLMNYGAIYGMVIAIANFGAGLGPTIAGATYDRFGTYGILFWSFIPFFAVSAAMLASLGPYQSLERR